MQIVVPESISFTKDQKARLEKLGTVKYFDGVPDSDEFIRRVEGADIVAIDWSPIDQAISKIQFGVKLVSVPYTGVGFIPLTEAAAKGIKIANAPGFGTESVGEFGIALTLALIRRINLYAKGEPEAQITPTVYGMTIGILGAGRIGDYVANVAKALGMKVIMWKRGDHLPNVLEQSDVVFCALSLTDETRGLLGAKEFGVMKKGSYFVSISPETIYDPDALIGALNSNLAGAAMDLNITPGDYKSPAYLKFKDNAKVLITPHVAWKTHYAVKRSYDIMIDNIAAFIRGKPINLVN